MKRITAGKVGIVQGSRVLFSHFVNDGPMWAGDGAREARASIVFSEPFLAPPAVSATISLWDFDKGTNLRAEITPERVAEDGFDLVFRTWGDTRVARIRADWLAIGPVRDEDDWDLG